MTKFDVTYFDHGFWKYIRFQVLAESEEQVRQLVDKKCPKDRRVEPYFSSLNRVDSLVIDVLEVLTFPHIVWYPDSLSKEMEDYTDGTN